MRRGDEIPLLLVQGERLGERVCGPGFVSVRVTHVREVDEDLGMRGDVVVAGHEVGSIAGEGDGLGRLAAAREHACPCGLPLRRIREDGTTLLELRERVLVPALGDEHMGDSRAVERDVVRRPHLRCDVDRAA